MTSTISKIDVIRLKNKIPVYDIEVPGLSNFVLESGVVVHNSKDESDSLAGAYLDAARYKDEYLFFSPSEVDYEGLNPTKSDEDIYLDKFRSSITKSTKTPVDGIKKIKFSDDDDDSYFPSFGVNSNILDW